MLTDFTGGYLFHPAALEYSGNTCTNGCAYCFANINTNERESKLKSAIKYFYKKDPVTYMDYLIHFGYPVCVSNRSDPFSKANLLDTSALFTHLAQLKNPIFIQTKCGDGMEDIISLLGDRRDVVIYITITTINDDISRRVEPNAPVSSKRFEIAKKYHDAGYLVLIAPNPLTESWMPRGDLEVFQQTMRVAGLNHVCLEILDMSRTRIKTLSDKKRQMMGEQALADCQSKAVFGYVRECTESFIQNGFSVAKKGMPFRTTFFDDVKARLGKTMPVLQDFINYCFDKKGDGPGVVVTYDEFEKVICQQEIFNARVEQNTLRGHLLRSGFDVWKDNQQVHSHKQLLRILWNDPRGRLSIQNHCSLRVIGKNGTPEKDADGNVKMFFSGEPYFGKRKEVFEL